MKPGFFKKRFFIKAGLLLACFLFLFFFLFLLLNLIFPLPDKVEYSTIVTDNRNEIINAFLTSDDKWRIKAELKEISPLLRKTIISKEDKYFYQHPGVNVFAVTRAFFKNLTRMKKTSGASTITMQVARALEPRKRNVGSKIIEMFRAFQLEWKYSKAEILQLYFNLIPYGGNIEGVKAASFLYFNKNPDHLSLAEITALSIIPNRPSSMVMGRNNDLIIRERNRWLKKFASDKIFTEKEIEDALAEPLTATRGSFPHHAHHLSNRLRQYTSGLVKTNLELNTQLKTEKLVEDYVRVQRLRNIRNASVIIIDNKTHNVISYVGSSGFYDTTDGGQVNGARAVRQPGSTLKPLLYAICMDEGFMTPKMVMSDVAINYDGYSPENYNQQYNGYVSVEYALEHSLNIPAVKSMKMIGKDMLINKLAAIGFRQVEKDRNKLGLSMILGGCGTTLEELTGLFSSFANKGIYAPPRYLNDQTEKKEVRVISEAANYMIGEILSKVNRPDFPLNWQATERMPKIAWKTGTSYGRRDAWSIGYNKNYTVGVWLGNFSGEGVADLSGTNTATPLLFRIFNTIDYDTEQEWFDQPEDCATRLVCGETGLPPSDHCTNLVMDYFIPLISGTKTCNNLQEVLVSADEKISYCRNCAPESGYKKKTFRFLEPEMQSWYSERQLRYDKIPSHNPDCEIIFRGNAPAITYPVNGAEYIIDRKDPEPLMLTCRTANDVSRVFWYINNDFYKAVPAGARQFFIPKEGPVKISCTDDKGRNRDIWIRVRYANL